MKKLITNIRYTLMFLLMLLMGVQTAMADNDELDKESNFNVTRSGASALHFRLLTWAEGGHNHWAQAGDPSYVEAIIFEVDDNGNKVAGGTSNRTLTIFTFNGFNGSDKRRDVELRLLEGSAVITNSSSMVNIPVQVSENKTRTQVNATEKHTFLEFDWYPDQDMLERTIEGKKHKYAISIKMHIHHTRNGGATWYPVFQNSAWTFNLSESIQTVELSTPFFYPMGGETSAGKIAIPYTMGVKPKSYYTSIDTTKRPLAAQGGMLFVEAQDTCLGSYSINVTALRDGSTNQTWSLSSNAVTVPAYHKIHDFKVTGDTVNGVYVGAKKLSWDIHYADDDDILPDDNFIIERAYKSDFSDVTQIEILPYIQLYHTTDALSDQGEKPNIIRHYEYVDNSQGAWLNPENPELPVYYRVRRASSSSWGYNHAWAAIDSIINPVYLAAPSKDLVYKITKDVNYDKNKLINVEFSMHGSCIPKAVEHHMSGDKIETTYVTRTLLWNKSAKLYLVRHMKRNVSDSDDSETVKILVSDNDIVYDSLSNSWKGRVSDAPKYPCTYYSYTLELETDFNTTLPKLTPALIDCIVAPAKDGSHGDYIVEAKGATRVPDYASVAIVTKDDLYFDEAARAVNLKASKGTYNDHVELTWDNTAGECDYYRIKRVGVNEQDTVWITDGQPLLTDCYYNDSIVIGGKEYKYYVESVLDCNGGLKRSITLEDTIIGSANRRAHVFGKLYYTNGMAMAGVEVRTEYDGKTISTKTKEDGTYELIIENRPTTAATIVIEPVVKDGTTFTLPGSDETKRSVTIGDDRSAFKNVYTCDFTSKDYLTFAGRVLYEGTSVPVSDAFFRVNGKLAKYNNGKEVRTDGQGNFEVTVPKGIAFTLQAVKDKHKFVNDGYFVMMNASGRDTTALVFAEHQYEKYMYDQTKVRLIGRVVGGNDQGNLPLGMDRSHNNLGDDLQMVFALEGNDVAHLVYNPNDKTEKVRDMKYTHADGAHATKAHFETKRIVVNPDSLSGEFVIDLLPVKYKVTQATAKGYSTLFGKSVGATVVDLTNKLDTMYVDEDQKVHYNDTFSIVYHAPVQLTFQQTNYGRALEYFGDADMAVSDFNKQETRIKVAQVDAEGNVAYTFGHPVFNGISLSSASKNTYAFNLSAHEDYYYNNDMIASTPEMVYLKGGKVKVSNGFDIKPDSKNEYVELDHNGKGIARVTVWNPTFKLTGEDALRSLQFTMDYNGEIVHSDVLEAYVTGAKEMGSDIIGRDIKVHDVLRDPPGSASNAWLEEGTSYAGTYTLDISYAVGLTIQLNVGKANTILTGTVVGAAGNGALNAVQSSDGKVNSYPISFSYGDKFKSTWGYTFTTTERIQTSSSDAFVGHQGDVYIGTEFMTQVNRYKTITIIPDSTYQRIAPAIKAGEIKILAKGLSPDDPDGKENVYLAVSNEITFTSMPGSSFAYTQKHLIKNLIPELIATRNALIQIGDSAGLQNVANVSGKPVYRSLVPMDDDNFGLEDYYQQLCPEGVVFQDTVAMLNKSIATWGHAIATNERMVLEAFYQTSKIAGVSVSAGTSKQNTESAVYSYSHNSPPTSKNFYNSLAKTGVGVLTKWASKLAGNLKNGAYAENPEYLTKNFEKIVEDFDKRKNTTQENSNNWFGAEWKMTFSPISDFSYVGNIDESKKHTRTMGYKIEEGSNGHIDVGVYRCPRNLEQQFVCDYLLFPDEEKKAQEQIKGLDWSLPSDFLNEKGKAVDVKWDDEKYNAADFIYITYGGATRCPYEGAEYTYFYQPGTPLNFPTLKIDDPKIRVTNPVASDVPVDQPAVFDIVLSNETEAPEADGGLIDKTFNFLIDTSTNPNGAKFYLDGYPLGNGMSIVIPAGKAVHKKLEMYRGTEDDYENIKLLFVTACEFANGVNTTISAHFQRSSTPLNLSSPTDKWVMNTLSPQNDGKFYIPVKIDGFNTDYRNFDHIELQYKRTTQPDEDYVSVCSFYSDSTLYAKASGEKRMIKGGVIDNIYFYGDNDPVEYNYDLRAVSFCRLGNDFVTATSKVLSGVKDTRRPEVFGSVSPKNGILGVGDCISIPFSETIAANHLDKTTNFEVLAYTNKTGITGSTSLLFSGAEDNHASTELTRNLADKNFTIDMMVQPNGKYLDRGQMTFFTQGNKTSYVELGSTPESKLYMTMAIGKDSVTVVSDSVYTDGLSWSRIAAVYACENGAVTFYRENSVIGSGKLLANYNGVGKFTYGNDRTGKKPYAGNMQEARLWTRALDATELNSTRRVSLTGYERKLLAYYPMNEGRGAELEDKANGATLLTNGQTWSLPSGRSLHFDGKQIVELDASLFARSEDKDYTLGFWFKAEAQQPDTITALYAEGDGTKGNRGLFIGLEKGKVKVAQNGFVQMTDAASNYSDGSWHHFVMGVNRVQNKSFVYVDGKRIMQFAADSLGALGVQRVWLGAYSTQQGDHTPVNAYCLNGNIDDLMLWKIMMSEGYMKQFDNTAPNGGEMGLMVNLPFSTARANINNIIENVYDGRNHLVKKEHNATIAEKQVVLTADAQMQEMSDNVVIAPVRERDLISTMRFSYTSRDNELVINLLPNDEAEINKQNVFVTVYDVEDMAGNTTSNPVNMTIFVDRNRLKWDRKYVEREQWSNSDDEFTVDIKNHGGSLLNYRIEELPNWLTVDEEMGYLSPTDERPVKFRVKPNLNPGEHSSLIYLTDENGLSEPLLVTVKVIADRPSWTVDRAKFSESMNVIASVKIADENIEYYDTDSEDFVGAFIGNTCVGVQEIDASDGLGSVYMTVYGGDPTLDMFAGGPGNVYVNFRLWRHKTGKIYNLGLFSADDTTPCSVRFVADTIYGKPEAPVVLKALQQRVQMISLNKGWNWVSFNITPLALDGHPFSVAMINDYPFTGNDVIKTTGQYVQYADNKGLGSWVGSMGAFSRRQCYMFRVSEGGQLEIAGSKLDVDAALVTLNNGWNYLPYYGQTIMDITHALAGYRDNVSDGDIVKSYTEFAVWSNGRWNGSLTELCPGQGYLLMRNGKEQVTMRYPRYEVAGGVVQAKLGAVPEYAGAYSGNMPVVATAMHSDGTPTAEGDVLQAYCGNTLVGEAVADSDGKFYLMTSAEAGGLISFRLTRSGASDDSQAQAEASQFLTFDELTAIGSVTEPYMIDFRNASAGATPNPFVDIITFHALTQPGDMVSISVCGMAGNEVFTHDDVATGARYQYTTAKLAALLPGIYIVNISVNGKNYAVKVIKKA